MASGGCFCEKIRIQYSGEPITTALCHCSDCRKLTGALYTYSFLVKSVDLVITGNPKEIAKMSDSEKHYKNYFCADCGTSLYGMKMKSDQVPEDTIVLRGGIFDDIEFLNQHKPALEIYTEGRVKWVCPTGGADQYSGMPPQQ
ncbi:hypothetical protein AAFC00_003932 [Neodothiora populina]|uniref:CENP-V/GFA domain-containing protein n=1 Tax=Neodothiora populina TaxID=2781224 RepID=A0ABR3PFY2_9PEZI